MLLDPWEPVAGESSASAIPSQENTDAFFSFIEDDPLPKPVVHNPFTLEDLPVPHPQIDIDLTPLVDDQRRVELHTASYIVEHLGEVDNDDLNFVVETRVEFDKIIEEKLLSDGFSRESLLKRRNLILECLFNPRFDFENDFCKIS